MAKTITIKQQAVFDFIEGFTKLHGHTPSQAEIQHHFEWDSRNTVLRYLDALETKGKIRRAIGRHRNIVLI